MNDYLFGISVVLMLLFAGTGLTRCAAVTLQHFGIRSRLAAPTIASGALLALIVMLSVTVPARG
ncbi:hypothetical protein DF139_04930 [Burkholderia stagnalis]|uniref:hypothetical protein n=1 Tax=Burkholderia stagnalis TaxID=1503054 RepID=UPI000F5681FD|nr:hypothetical protein [Burkholderia stagnalis]RQQ73112.1 hypothetical protein DF137_04555 [Burkholderia stagnalis]RQQ74601.1 hypothetical protein DF139_04930 [Burkholderia stagnalis]RQQ86757.1 hypothetical protein DF138_01280 [Burkholderia stagnalis]RQQ95501.1 hypothetical protein DF136_05055 [Burkholderia stagnalis]